MYVPHIQTRFFFRAIFFWGGMASTWASMAALQYRIRLDLWTGALGPRSCHGKIHPFLIGKPSIKMGHLYHGELLNYQRVYT